MAEVMENELVEAVIDLEAGTWTCSVHGTVMAIESGEDCADCMNAVHAPPDRELVLIGC